MNQTSIFDIPEPDPTPFERGMIESAKAARRWTDQQVAEIDSAIAYLARTKSEFTADDIWTILPDNFPVTKGLAARLNKASNAGLILATDRTRKSTRTNQHGHGQRLTVWQSLG